VLSYLPVLVDSRLGVFGLVVTGIVLDFAVQMNMVLGQREIYALDAASRNRLNSIYMTSIFIGGALGSSLASMLHEKGGWSGVAMLGTAFPLVALAHFVTTSKRPFATT
jgi:predicted MFS family arabinose efflux permease